MIRTENKKIIGVHIKMIIHIIEIQKNMMHIIHPSLNTSFTSNHFSKVLSGNVNRRPDVREFTYNSPFAGLSKQVIFLSSEEHHRLPSCRSYPLGANRTRFCASLLTVALAQEKGTGVFRHGVEKLRNRA